MKTANEERVKDTVTVAAEETAAETAAAGATVSPIEQPDSIGSWIKRVAYGALVGVGAVLPGVSGGAFCAAFGIYRPMMDFLAHPTKNFKKNIRFFLPFLIGCGLGFVLLSGLVSKLLALSAAIVTAFFIGCIIGTMPSLYKEADGSHWKFWHWLILGASTLLSGAGLMAMNRITDLKALISDPGSLQYVIVWAICGMIFVLGAIVPGMSPSAIIMYAGLYEYMTGAIGSLKLDVLLPFALGAVLCLALFSKLISFLFNRAGSSMFAFVIGVVIASTVLVAWEQVILPVAGAFTLVQLIGAVVSAAAGFGIVMLLAKLDPR